LESADVQAKEVHLFLKAKGRTEGYPLFEKVYNICWEGLEVEKLTEGL
jgi:glycerol-3-phosphate dehydrogenase (NAD+)